MRWNYLSILKFQQLYRWSVGIDKYIHPRLCWACDYLSMLELKLIHLSKSGPRWASLWQYALCLTNIIKWTHLKKSLSNDLPRTISYMWTHFEIFGVKHMCKSVNLKVLLILILIWLFSCIPDIFETSHCVSYIYISQKTVCVYMLMITVSFKISLFFRRRCKHGVVSITVWFFGTELTALRYHGSCRYLITNRRQVTSNHHDE